MSEWIEKFRVGEIDGHPLARTPHHEDDCLRWGWHVKIGDKWHEVESSSLNFDADYVMDAIKRIKEGVE
jgi:hypothetical protein